MKSVFCDREPARVGYFQSVLENEGILCFVRNQHTNTTMSEMPSGLFFPVLCVVDDADFDRAITLIRDVRDATPENLPEWVCEQCREAVPGGFDLCWNCGADRAGLSRPGEGAQ